MRTPSRSSGHRVVDAFSPSARALRAHFDARFRDPKGGRGDRFVWDYWHVPGQYTHLKTPAYHFFPPALYRTFHEQLVNWGRENLGCHDVSPPWLSCYVEGSHQNLHGDLPHGPWAWVFSLTPWRTRRFRGGETLLLREEILDYWREMDFSAGLEEDGVLRKIPPLFNRLTIFDPRIPHGVSRLEGGVQDVCEGRLVIHGWFVQPRPFIRGPLAPAQLQRAIGELTDSLGPVFASIAPVRGMASYRLRVSARGDVIAVRGLAHSLRSAGGGRTEVPRLLRHIVGVLRETRFPRSRGPSDVTLPLVFEA